MAWQYTSTGYQVWVSGDESIELEHARKQITDFVTSRHTDQWIPSKENPIPILSIKEQQRLLLRDAIIDLSTSEQQQLYEFMHNALGLRIR